MRLLIILLTLICLPALAVDVPEYDRSEYFSGWQDDDGDCQDARTERLILESYIPYYGVWETDASKIHFDHIVPLANAHESGAYLWPESLKKEFANDSENLWLSSASANMSKRDRSPDKWLPKDLDTRCLYVTRWSYIKKKYVLEMTDVESEKIQAVLNFCSNR